MVYDVTVTSQCSTEFRRLMTSSRFVSDRTELAERIDAHISHDGRKEVRPGLYLNRTSQVGEVVYAVAEPSLCVIAQGSKEVFLGNLAFRYDPAHYLVSTMALPISGKVLEASIRQPYLSLRIVLEPSLVTSVLAESGYSSSTTDSSATGIDVSVLGEKLLDAVLRLVRLLDDPREYQVLAASTLREIVFRLADSQQSHRLFHVANLGGQSHRMVQAIRMIRERFNLPIRSEDIADELHMSVSSFLPISRQPLR